MPKKSLIIFLSLILISTSFIFAGGFSDAANMPSNSNDNKRVYVLDIGSSDVMLDHSGNVLLTGSNLEILERWETKEQFYVTDRRIVARSGQEPVYSEALYTLDGGLLIDYDSVQYSAVANGIVLCDYRINLVDGDYKYYQNTESYLLNLHTMRKVKLPPDKGYPIAVWDKYLAYTDYSANYFRIIDFSGKEVFSLENSTPMPEEWNDYLLLRYGYGEGDSEYVLDKNFRIIYSGNEMRLLGMSGETLIIDGKAITRDGELLGDFLWRDKLEGLVYFDDEIALVQSWIDSGFYKYVLLDQSNTVLADGVSGGIIELPYGEERAERFIALKDNEIVTIDRDGRMSVFNKDKSFMSLEVMPGDKIIGKYVADDAEYESSYWWQASSGVMVFDKNGSVLLDIPPYSKSLIRSDIELWSVTSENVWYSKNPDDSYCLLVRKVYDDRWDSSSIDIYGPDADLIVKNASTIYEVDKDRLLLAHGFSIGMMDYDGNWLYRTSAFELMEE